MTILNGSTLEWNNDNITEKTEGRSWTRDIVAGVPGHSGAWFYLEMPEAVTKYKAKVTRLDVYPLFHAYWVFSP